MKKIKTMFEGIIGMICLIIIYFSGAFVAALEGKKTKKITLNDFLTQTLNCCHAIQKGEKYEYSF